MGKQNRERRAAKRRRRPPRGGGSSPQAGPHRRRDEGPTAPGADGEFSTTDVEQMIVAASEALRVGDNELFDNAINLLDDGPPIPGGQALVDRTISTALRHALRRAWFNGWQPADMVRVVNRSVDRSTASLVTDVIAEDMSGYAAKDVHPRWQDQVADLGASIWWSHDKPHLPQWASRSELDRVTSLRIAIRLLCFMHHLPKLPLLGPPPGPPVSGYSHQSTAWAAPKAASSPVLERVRALLTKAESTTFPEEAEALSAKAQELMATHSIDRIAMAAERGGDQRPIGRRIGIDDPYAAPKSLLLDKVAQANRCRAAWTSHLGFSTVFGAEGDVDSVDVLFTSLLTQAASALRIADRRRQVVGAGRTRSFRQSFHVGYAVRIGDRLTEVAATMEDAATASHGSSLLPVLAGHAQDVDDALDAAFPTVGMRSMSVSNRAGWTSGVAAAEMASLTVHPEVGEPSA